MMWGTGREMEHQARTSRLNQKAVRERMRHQWEAQRLAPKSSLLGAIRRLFRRGQGKAE